MPIQPNTQTDGLANGGSRGIYRREGGELVSGYVRVL
jgi:hypothetical protein